MATREHPIKPGMRFGAWIVIERAPNNSTNHVMFVCKCDCGARFTREAKKLLQSKNLGCSTCHPKARQKQIAPGTVFGCWTVLRQGERDKHYGDRYICRCECGHEQLRRAALIRSGKNLGCKSCVAKKHRPRSIKIANGSVFGAWTVLMPKGRDRKSGAQMYLCRCRCGKNLVRSRAYIISRNHRGCRNCFQ